MRQLVNIDFTYWKENDLEKISDGFRLLNANVVPSTSLAFAKESGGSPQIMHELCLALCLEDSFERDVSVNKPISLSLGQIAKLASSCIMSIDRERITLRLRAGPDTRGTPRYNYQLINGETLDVYGCIMSAIALNPPMLNLSAAELTHRISGITPQKSPLQNSIITSVKQMIDIAKSFDKKTDFFDWDEDKGLHILDPYLLFFIRWTKEYRERRDDLDLIRRAH